MTVNAGFIGLGAMGAPMARNLHQAGLLGAVWNRTPAKSRELADELGIPAADSLPALAAQCPVLISCVSADADLLHVIDTLLPALQPDTLFIDMSTVSRETAQQAEQLLSTRGVHFVDAPVSGGVEGACKGNLSIMAGGRDADLERARPFLSAMGERITHMGPVGAGQATKAVNQVMAAGINQAVTEALAFAEALELPLDKVIEVVGGGAAGNWFLNHRGPTLTQGRYEPGFKVELHHKDLDICKRMAAQRDVAMPLVEMTLIHYRRLMAAGFGAEDISALHREKRTLFKLDTESDHDQED